MTVESSQLLLFLALNAIVLLNALWLTCLFRGWQSWTERWLDCFLYFVALVVVGFEVLHRARWITLDGLFIVHIVTALALGWVAHRRGWEIRGAFSLAPIKALGWGSRALLCLPGAWFCAYIHYCRYLPPRGTDALLYHLPLAVEWLKARELVMLPAVFTASPYTYAPINGELFFAWLLAPFGIDIVMRFGQMPFLAAAMLAVFVVGRRWNLPTPLALGCGGLLLIYRPFLREIVLPNNDLMAMCWLLIFVTQWQRLDADWRSWARCGLALGMLAGTKVVGLLYVVACLALIVARLVPWRRTVPVRRMALGWGCLAVALAVLGGFSYVRNWLVTGNPVFPAIVRVGGIELFHGILDSNVMAAAHRSSGSVVGFLLSTKATFGMPVVTASIWSLAIIAAPIVWLWRGRRRAERGDVIWIWLLLLLGFVLIVWRVPFWEERMLFPIYALGLLMVVYLFGEIQSLGPKWVPVAGVGLVAVIFGAEAIQIRTILRVASLLALVFFALLGASLWLEQRVAKRPLTWIAPGIVVFALGFLCILWPDAVRRYQAAKFQLYPPAWPRYGPGWIWLNESTRARGVTVAYAGNSSIYPLYGQDLQNRVIYVPVQQTPRRYWHEFPWPDDARLNSLSTARKTIETVCRSHADPDAWLRRLVEMEVTFLVLLREGDTELIEARWVEQYRAFFERVFEHDGITIYWVRSAPTPAP